LIVSVAAFAPQQLPPERISYTTSRPANWDLYYFAASGEKPRKLTSDPGLEYDAAVSPDGRWVVFTSERRGNPDLYVLDLQAPAEPRLLIDSSALEDQASFSADGSSLVFVSTEAGSADIYSIPFTPDKTVQMSSARPLVQHPSADLRPALSPDGTLLAFSSDRDLPVRGLSPIIRLRDGDLYVLDIASKKVQRVTSSPGWEGSPTWSPEGKTIAFYSQEGVKPDFRMQQARIWLVARDGSNPRVLTAAETLALSPEFSPDGRILYSRRRPEGAWQIVSIKADGSDERVVSDRSLAGYWEPTRASGSSVVAHGPGSPARPDNRLPSLALFPMEGAFQVAGSPLRKKLPDREIDVLVMRSFTAALNPAHDLVALTAPPGGSDLLLAKPDGSRPFRLFMLSALQSTFAGISWSKDGEWLAFTQGDHRAPDRAGDIWRIRRNGTGLQNLTPSSPASDTHPSYAADGRILFRSGRDGRFDVYLMNGDGTNVRRVTDDPGAEVFPVISPDGRQVAFASDRDRPGTRVHELYLADLDENGRAVRWKRVTSNDVQEGHAVFSPDGKWLLYVSEQGGISDEEPLVQSILFAPQMYGELFAHRIADGVTLRLTHNKWEDGVPSWEPGLPPRR
jgi:Tol biopolymer transport system component